MATIKEIAALAGVSRGTVDRVLNDRGAVNPETAEKIRKIAKELDYKPNRAGLVLDEHQRDERGVWAQRGEDVLIFPEGTRIRSREIKPEVHGGFALIAQMGKAPVNPLAICGWSDITPAGKKLMRPKKCWIRAGKAVSLSDAPAELKRKERLAWFESEAMCRVYAMRDDLCAEHPGRF